jgi:archaea-specific RecJ-like exonuclease
MKQEKKVFNDRGQSSNKDYSSNKERFSNNDRFSNKDRFNSRERTSYEDRTPKRECSSIKGLADGDYFKGIVKITRRAVPGPVILGVSDGFASVDAVSKECDFQAGDIVELAGPVSERAGKLQIEIKHIVKAAADFDSIIEEKSKPIERPLSVKSEKLDVLRPYLLAIAHKIRKAIINNQPILIRHHADADGISSGLAVEKACELFMNEIGVNPDYTLYRSPSKAPFYDIVDMFKDVSFTKKLLEGHGQQKPLILVFDNGSTPEDLFAMKTLKSLGFDVIVIDHHNPVVFDKKTKKTAVCPYVSLHVNPYMEGFDGQITAGMLCYETARLIHSKFDQPLYPAVSAIGDRSAIPEAAEYLSNAKKSANVSDDDIKKMVIAIDFLSYNLKFADGDGMYDDILSNKEFREILNVKVNQGVETQLQSTLPYLRTHDIEGVTFSHIDLEKYTLRFTYPTPGNVTGKIHDLVAQGKEQTPVMTLGCLSDMIIVRATKPILPVAKIIATLKKEMPQANVDGGGHECAGSIRFVSAHSEAILERIKTMVKEVSAKIE